MDFTIEDSRLNSDVKKALYGFQKTAYQLSNHHSDVWITFRAAGARYIFFENLKEISTLPVTKFRNAIEESLYPYGVEVSFAFDYKAKK